MGATTRTWGLGGGEVMRALTIVCLSRWSQPQEKNSFKDERVSAITDPFLKLSRGCCPPGSMLETSVATWHRTDRQTDTGVDTHLDRQAPAVSVALDRQELCWGGLSA